MPANREQPLISVIIPAWNADRYITATLESVFTQNWPAVEAVVIDDGSTDGTRKLLAAYGNRISTEYLENSGGPSRPRNHGIALAKGDFISFFDSDDLMEPEKLARAMDVFIALPGVDFVFSNFRSIDMEGKVLNEDYLAGYVDFRRDLEPTSVPDTWLLKGDSAFRNLLRANFIGTSSVVCRRTLFDDVGFFDEDMKNADDIDMWLRIAGRGCTFAYVDRVLHSYRITPGGVTARGANRIPAMIKGLENQLETCSREADRRFIHGQIRRLQLGRAWALRQSGEYEDAIRCYREGLAMGLDVRGVFGLIRTRLESLIRRK